MEECWQLVRFVESTVVLPTIRSKILTSARLHALLGNLDNYQLWAANFARASVWPVWRRPLIAKLAPISAAFLTLTMALINAWGCATQATTDSCQIIHVSYAGKGVRFASVVDLLHAPSAKITTEPPIIWPMDRIHAELDVLVGNMASLPW